MKETSKLIVVVYEHLEFLTILAVNNIGSKIFYILHIKIIYPKIKREYLKNNDNKNTHIRKELTF